MRLRFSCKKPFCTSPNLQQCFEVLTLRHHRRAGMHTCECVGLRSHARVIYPRCACSQGLRQLSCLFVCMFVCYLTSHFTCSCLKMTYKCTARSNKRKMTLNLIINLRFIQVLFRDSCCCCCHVQVRQAYLENRDRYRDELCIFNYPVCNVILKFLQNSPRPYIMI